MRSKRRQASLSRRQFMIDSAGASALLAASPSFGVLRRPRHEEVRVGLVGCGGRGTGAARDCAAADENVTIVALADAFPQRLASSRQHLAEHLGARAKVADDHCFVGFDAYRHLLATECDLVILATPPGFRPQHFAAAVAKGKHVFMEKPVAVCPAGVRQVLAAAEAAKTKRLAVVAGTQRRHQASYLATIEHLHQGAIGDITSASCWWNQGALWVHERGDGESDVEWQLRNWLYFAWLSGDHIVEQHIHNIDVINWVMRSWPVKATGMGGRQVRTDPRFGHIYDHFAIEFEYVGGVKLTSWCRQIDGCANRVGEEVRGTKGVANPGGSIRGEVDWQFKGQNPNPYVQEHADLLQSMRIGQPINEGQQVAYSTLTAIMGRMAAYTGKEVTWKFALEESKLDLRPPEKLELGARAVDPVAVPGLTPLV